MKLLGPLFAAVMIFSSCSENLDPAKTYKIKPNDKLDNITWEQYLKYCDEGNSEAPGNYKLLHERSVTWQGQATFVEKTERSGYGGNWLDEELRIKMEPSRGTIADVRLYLERSCEKDFKSIKVHLTDGDIVQFTGNFRSRGGGMSDHILICKSLKRIGKPKPKEEAKPSQRSSVR
ncbi:MAG: hypothetical protein RL095_69 [Verrucomicrobiota bacterium]